MTNTERVSPQVFLLDLVRDILDPKLDPLKRKDVVAGYARLMELREESIMAAKNEAAL